MNPAPTFVVGHVYRIRATIEGVWNVPREMVYTYLGPGSQQDELLFNARPEAGTQSLTIRPGHVKILKVEDLGPSAHDADGGRGDRRHRLPKIVPPGRR